MSVDVATQNVIANTLKGMGTGGSTGASNGIALLKDADLWAEAQPKFTSPIGAYWPDKFFQGIQGFVQSITPNQLFSQLAPPVTPLGGGQKLPNVMGKR